MEVRILLVAAAILVASALGSMLRAHCQIPCGIYDDPARFAEMLEHVATIEKSMQQIDSLSRAERPNHNQLVRWVNNKEAHADKLSEIVTFYFMAQRVKPRDAEDAAAYQTYVTQITLLHGMLVNAMKAKQTTELDYCAKLRAGILQFKRSYLSDKAHESHPHPGHRHTTP